MRTKVFRATCPRRVLWGDPVYLAGDTVDTAASVIKEQSIPESFQAKIILEERHDEEYIDVVMLNVGIYMAREQQLPMYLKNMMFSSQEEIVYPVNVNSAGYLLDIDGRSAMLRTESNGCWGYGCFLYWGKMLDALILDIGLPETETMESAEQLIAALFENVSLEESKDGRDSGRPCEEKGSASQK